MLESDPIPNLKHKVKFDRQHSIGELTKKNRMK